MTILFEYREDPVFWNGVLFVFDAHDDIFRSFGTNRLRSEVSRRLGVPVHQFEDRRTTLPYIGQPPYYN